MAVLSLYAAGLMAIEACPSSNAVSDDAMPCLGTDKLVAVLSAPLMLISSNEESTHEKSGADGGTRENVARRENVAIFEAPRCAVNAGAWCCEGEEEG